MSETLEQISKRISEETDAHLGECVSRDSVIWCYENASRLVAALGAQEPVAWHYATSGSNSFLSYSGPEEGFLTGGQPLYSAPYIKEGWQMVPNEPTLHEGRPYQEWYSRKIEECGDPQDMPSGGLSRSAPEYGK